MNFSSAILTMTLMSLISLVTACGSPLLVMPDINYVSYAELKAKEPDCTAELSATERAFIGGSGLDQEAACIETFRCYHEWGAYWRDGYRVLDSKVRVLNAGD